MESRRLEGLSVNTLRKERQLALGFYSWAQQAGLVDSRTHETIKAIPPPALSTGRVKPDPYSPKELRIMMREFENRWPLLPILHFAKTAERWREGRASYKAIRNHAIRLQLGAIVALALHGGLSRREIFGLDLNDAHYDNENLIVWRGARWTSERREVPFTRESRETVAAWIECRSAIGPKNDRIWLNLWSESTANEPMASGTFDKVLMNYLGAEWSFRRLRHTAGTSWLQAGLSVWELQKLLGHRRLSDTLPYADRLETDLGERVRVLDDRFSNRLPLAH